jgi:hypothetical protein
MPKKGYVKSPEHRAALSAAGMGHEVSAETRAKISAALRRRYQDDPSLVANMSAYRRGRKLTPEHRQKIAVGVGRGEECATWKGDDACYEAIHQRLGRLLGAAKEHVCVDCGKQACHWSLKHDAQQVIYDKRRGSPYSTNPDDYEPRCVSDHIRYDRGRKEA